MYINTQGFKLKYSFQQVQIQKKMSRQIQSSHMPFPTHPIPLFLTSFTNSSQYDSLFVLNSLQFFDICTMTCSYHYCVIWSSFIALKICISSVHHSLPLKPQQLQLFYFFQVFPFPECHMIGIIQYIAFSGWLL